MVSILKHQAGDDPPMQVLACSAVDREDVPDSQPRLDAADGFEVDTEACISRETVVPGIVLVQFSLPSEFQDGNELQRVRQRQLLVRDGVAENEGVFERLQTI